MLVASSAPMTAHDPAHDHVFKAVGLGIPWANIISWIAQAGLPLLLQVLQLLFSGGTSGLTVAQIVAWVQQALAALQNKQPAPPLPKPVP